LSLRCLDSVRAKEWVVLFLIIGIMLLHKVNILIEQFFWLDWSQEPHMAHFLVFFVENEIAITLLKFVLRPPEVVIRRE